EVEQQADAMVLGARQFAGAVPFRSRLGNEATAWAVRFTSGLRLADTQTGLRGYPAALLPWLLSVPGDRYEYELSALLAAQAQGIRIVELPIETVYHDGNAGSHFRPLADSARVYAPLLRFAASSLAAAVIDFVGLLALMAATGNLLMAVVGARVISATVNFAVNRRLVFRQPRSASLTSAASRYAALAIGLLICNFLLMWTLTSLGLALLAAKLLTETVLYLTSFAVQHRVVFRGGQALGAGASGAVPAHANPLARAGRTTGHLG
ncbi:MAG: GtrA family protein, partial [Candidatus Nanopelagicales bacterium]